MPEAGFARTECHDHRILDFDMRPSDWMLLMLLAESRVECR